MNFEEDFGRRNPGSVEMRRGSTYIDVDAAGAFIAEAEQRGIGILGMEGFLIGEFTNPALSRIADFSIARSDTRLDFVAWSCEQARELLTGSWRSPPTGDADQINPEASGRYMIEFTLAVRPTA